MKVAIIGSGIAGLAAASILHQRHCAITVYEADAHVGGHAWTVTVPPLGSKPSISPSSSSSTHGKSKRHSPTSSAASSASSASASSSSSSSDRRGGVAVDIGFQVFNQVTYPNMVAWFEQHGVAIEKSDMALSVSMANGTEWSSDGLNGIFANRCNLLSPRHHRMVWEMTRFEKVVHAHLADNKRDRSMVVGAWLKKHKFSDYFRDNYFMPMCAAVWSCPFERCMEFPTEFIFTFMRNHHLLQLTQRPQWLTVADRSETYVSKVTAKFADKIRTNTRIVSIVVDDRSRSRSSATAGGSRGSLRKGKERKDTKTDDTSSSGSGVSEEWDSRPIIITDNHGRTERFDHVVIAAHAPDALRILGSNATDDEREILGAFEYQPNEVVLHRDVSLLPRRRRAWASWNFLGYRSREAGKARDVCVSYWLNRLQNLSDPDPIVVTLNPVKQPRADMVVFRQTMTHPVPSMRSVAATQQLHRIQGKRNIWFCGAYTGYGFHEDGCRSGMDVANQLLRGDWVPLVNPRHFPLYSLERIARYVVFTFFRSFIKTGQIVIREVGGTVERFGTPTPPAPAPSSSEEECSAFSPPTHFATASITSLATPSVKVASTGSLFAPLGATSRTTLSSSRHSPTSSSSSSSSPASSPSSSPNSSPRNSGVSLSVSTASGRDILAPPVVNVLVHNASFYTKLAFRSDLGLADAFIDGDFTCNDMVQLVRLLIMNQRLADLESRNKRTSFFSLQSISSLFSAGATTLAYFRHKICRKNTVRQARRNIHEHYDLGNSFFATFLDPSMVYSCAIFKSPDDTLFQAQMNKLESLVSKARVGPEDHLLEIGCGWGALSLYAAKKTGCRVTGITVSEQQLKYCRDLLKRETELDRGLAGRVNFELVDYRVFARTRPRQFTRIISCEMLEAVGHEYLGDFFKSCEQLLTPEGLLVVQVITFPDHRYDAYRKSVDFIREYIFPGGLCPSNAALTSAMQKSSNFHVENLENIGPHYATTLSLWRERFWDFLRQRQVMDNGVSEVKYSSASGLISESKSRRRASAVAPLHAQRAVLDDEGNELPRGRDPTRNDRFVRMWHYYYVYCEAAFATRTLGTLQIVYSRQHNSSLA